MSKFLKLELNRAFAFRGRMREKNISETERERRDRKRKRDKIKEWREAWRREKAEGRCGRHVGRQRRGVYRI